MNQEKHVDESWKERATDEKDRLAEASGQQEKPSVEPQTEAPDRYDAGLYSGEKCRAEDACQNHHDL